MPSHTSRANCNFLRHDWAEWPYGKSFRWTNKFLASTLTRTLRFSVLITMDRRIELVISRIESETPSAWDTTTLARLVSLSPSRFRHLFKQETGTSPAQYVKYFRMRKAQLMLRTTFLSVKEILKQVGLRSNSHFVRDFRKINGVTPTAYRKAVWNTAKRRKSPKTKR